MSVRVPVVVVLLKRLMEGDNYLLYIYKIKKLNKNLLKKIFIQKIIIY
jgi:hypothetical protein